MDEIDFTCKSGEVERVFNCGISAANYGNRSTLEKSAVAGCAITDSFADEGCFTIHTQLFCLCATSNDDCFGFNDTVVFCGDRLDVTVKGYGFHFVIDEIHTKGAGLLLHSEGEGEAVCVLYTGIVFHLGSDCGLTAKGFSFNDDCFKSTTCAVYACGEPCRACAKN